MSQASALGVSNVHKGVLNFIRSPLYRFLARTGYVARGFLYLVMGYEAFLIARTGIGRKADPQSGFLAFANFPMGRMLLLASIIAIASYAIWGFVRALYDPLHRGSDIKGIINRLGFAWSGLAYSTLLIFAIALFTHRNATSGDGTQKMAGELLNAPFGIFLGEIAGLVGIASGLGGLYEAYEAPFKKDEKRLEMGDQDRKISDFLGRFGLFSRGVIFGLMGWFLLQAAFGHSAARAKDFSETFAYLVGQPYGQMLLTFLALGLVALGLHSVVLAKYIRLPGDDG